MATFSPPKCHTALKKKKNNFSSYSLCCLTASAAFPKWHTGLIKKPIPPFTASATLCSLCAPPKCNIDPTKKTFFFSYGFCYSAYGLCCSPLIPYCCYCNRISLLQNSAELTRNGFVIPRKKVLSRHSGVHGRVNFEARNGTEWNFAEKISSKNSQNNVIKWFVCSTSKSHQRLRNGIPRVYFYFVPQNGIPICFSSAEWFGTKLREFASIFVSRNGLFWAFSLPRSGWGRGWGSSL